MSLRVGTELGSLEIMELPGRGGIGEVLSRARSKAQTRGGDQELAGGILARFRIV